MFLATLRVDDPEEPMGDGIKRESDELGAVGEAEELVGVGHASRLSALRTLVEIYFLHCILFFLR